jgi:hypothetical protein
MPIMIGFARQRQQLIESEIARLAEELPKLGVLRAWVAGEFARGQIGPDTPLELVVVHDTSQPPHRRSDFFVDHLRPQLDTRFAVYTPEEAETLEESDRVLVQATRLGDPIAG